MNEFDVKWEKCKCTNILKINLLAEFSLGKLVYIIILIVRRIHS